ncbi:bifunctional enoyl-CoA hydratase/phosphate acetyltransferase [Bradyrhizobium diazoefficiens]|nr:bifunctional enoyl-CoA hydratase/phosphate acetyltransferase [Bradyrhizobium diazoefficiens]MBR0848947.1 bifunctional enoyl-CoA hydratase/phosphate acetyltransferase [Bradyrhizobium diazoefficiens]
MTSPAKVRNTIWDDLQIGAQAAIERTCSEQDVVLFAHVSGNLNPATLPSFRDGRADHSAAVAPSMWVGSLFSAVLGNLLPGPGTLYRSQSLSFLDRVQVGDRLRISVRCSAKGEKPLASFETRVERDGGQIICEGVAEVEVPEQRIEADLEKLPGLILDRADLFTALIARAARRRPLATAVVCPDDRNALGGALLSAERGLITPILIGDAGRIHRAAAEIGKDLAGIEIIATPDHHAAAVRAVAMVNAGQAGAIMKGNIHSDELLAEVVKKDGGLRTSRRISHVFVMDAPTLDDFLFISDAAINIAPDLSTKVDIVQNAIDLARACGVARPHVGILSAVETVNVNMPSTIDAAVLSKMADRGQITGGVVDGPLAMDNAIDLEAARTKGIASLVAGRAAVLIVPNLESGNMLAKELTFVARAEAAGLVVGARVPVMLTSRADNDRARLASCALAQHYDYFKRHGEPLTDASESAIAAE